jgi:aminoglycoside/choline kinase family phosphotransferase
MREAANVAPKARDLDFTRLEALMRTTGARGPLRVTEMAGGASTRRYFRVVDGSAEGGTSQTPVDVPSARTAVAMFVPEGAKPEEIAKDTSVPQLHNGRWPFLEVRDLLEKSGVHVPALYAEDQEHGWLLLEDLGDDTLANHLAQTSDPSARERLYRQAVLDLARAQRALATLPADSIVSSRAFDADLLRWEIDHFREWGLEARGHVLPPSSREAFDAIAMRLADRIASWPRGFVHRDYQSRNLMVRPNPKDVIERQLCWIDFQDALLGPPVYDLVALLNDSYQTFDRAFVEARLHDYAEAMMFAEDRYQTLLEQFDYVTVQRKLKDAGRFVFIDRTKGNPAFLRFVTPTISKVGQSLDRLKDRDPDMRALKELLIQAVSGEIDALPQPIR